jgi:hypothetical protein
MNQRALTEAEKTELALLNDAVDGAIQTRRDWLDAKMAETSKLKVGDDVYNLRSGARVGVVSELYRYHTERNDLFDTSHYCEYRYETHPNSFDNTSRQSGQSFGTREDAVRHAEYKLERLRQENA